MVESPASGVPALRRDSTGGARLSQAVALPAARSSFAAVLARRTLLPAAVALAVLLAAAAVSGARTARREVEERSRTALALTRGLLSPELNARLALARRLAAEPLLSDAARGSAVGPSGAAEAALAPEERAALESRLSPSALLEPESDASRWLRGQVGGDPSVRAAFFTEAAGVAVGGTAGGHEAVVSSRPWWAAARHSGAAVAFPGPGAGLPEGTWAVAAALAGDRPGQRPGVVVLVLSDGALRSALSDAAGGVGGTSVAALFDGSGNGLASGAAAAARLASEPSLAGLVSAPAGAGGLRLASAPDALAAALPAGGAAPLTELVVATAVARGSSGAVRALLAVGLPAAILLLAAALPLLPFLRRTSADLGELVAFARRTGAGDPAAPPLLDRDDEIGALGRALVGSLESLRSSRTELARSKRSLEERVTERTAELNRVNAELKKRAEELATASRAKDEFLTNISHELRTPLNAIIGFTQLVRDGLAESRQEEESFLDQVLVSSRHLLNLINDVLDLAKLEAGKVVLELSELPAGEVVDEVRRMVEAMAREKGLALVVESAADLPSARADRLRLRQVLLNLLQNAIKFTEKGQVSLRVRSSDGRRRLLFEVEDTGIGIPKEKRTLVFEKFIQAEAGTTRRFGGTGLGLPISRLLVEAMGGRIGLEDGSGGVGTRVWFTVPTPGPEGR